MDAFSSLFDSHFADPHRALANSLGGFVDHATARDDRHALIALLDEQCDYNYHLLSAHFHQDLARPAAFWNPMFYIRATTPMVPPVPVVPMVPPAPTAGA